VIQEECEIAQSKPWKVKEISSSAMDLYKKNKVRYLPNHEPGDFVGGGPRRRKEMNISKRKGMMKNGR
jgi:hypothetical protein